MPTRRDSCALDRPLVTIPTGGRVILQLEGLASGPLERASFCVAGMWTHDSPHETQASQFDWNT